MIIHTLFLPGDPAVTIHAADILVNSLVTGEKIVDALEVFCSTIMEGAHLAVH